MNIKKQRKINKPLAALAIVISLGVVAFLVYTFAFKKQVDNSIDASPSNEPTSDQQQAEHLSKSPDSKKEAPNADKPAPPISSDTSSKKQVQMSASTDTSNNTVYIRGGVNYPVTGGSCYAELTGPSGQSVRKDTTVLQNPASTDCKTISIPTSELASGKWKFVLHYTSDNYEGASSEISFSV